MISQNRRIIFPGNRSLCHPGLGGSWFGLRLPDWLGPVWVSGCSGGGWQEEICLASLWGGLISSGIPRDGQVFQQREESLKKELKAHATPLPHPVPCYTRLPGLQAISPLCISSPLLQPALSHSHSSASGTSLISCLPVPPTLKGDKSS